MTMKTTEELDLSDDPGPDGETRAVMHFMTQNYSPTTKAKAKRFELVGFKGDKEVSRTTGVL